MEEQQTLHHSHITKIKINDLMKIYKQGTIEVIALRGLSLEIKKGEIVAIEGPSGCGKTTLVNIIGGLDRQSAGEIQVFDNKTANDLPISLGKLSNRDLELYRKNRVGIIFQFMNLIPSLTAIENVEFPLLMDGIPKKERREKAMRMLRMVKMENRGKHKPEELSGGEQQRIAIAAALIHDPDIIIADEPTGNLDSETREEILDLFNSLIREFPNKSIILVTHDLAIERIATRILRIKDGIIVDERDPRKSIESNVDVQKLQDELAKYKNEITKIKKAFQVL